MDGGDASPARCAETMHHAAAEIELAIREANGPVENLGFAIGRMAAYLTDGSRIGAAGDETSGDVVDGDQLWSEVAICIENLQVFDRLVQRLTRVTDMLAGRAPAGAAGTGARPEAPDGPGTIELF